MSLITLNQASLAYGHHPLLDQTDFSLEEGERVGLIGRNGTGKSTLLKILNRQEALDSGTIQYQQGLRINYVAQEPIFDPAKTIFEVVSEGLGELLQCIDDYSNGIGDMDELFNRIDTLGGWGWEQKVDQSLEQLRLNGKLSIGTLSGGTLKRVALAQALVCTPQVLLLDEPTNHLDLESIDWLASLLSEFKGSAIVITHDRSFLDKVTTRIVELDRGRLRSYFGNYSQFRVTKENQLAQESVINAKADKLLAQEEIWIRKGVEARRTRSVARIARLEELRAQRQSRREAVGKVKLNVDAGNRTGKIVSKLENVSLSFGDRCIVKDFSSIILRGDKIGLLGPNGAGKTTLLKLILGSLEPDAGSVKFGTQLQIAYFDQMRGALNLDDTLENFISPGSEWIEIGDQRQHVKSYLGDFLFSPARANSPVRSLSGGERNRLLLARLFARPANVLVLDEPTNDLDIETLELLEELLENYKGTVFLVSHDRAFLDNVVTSLIAYEGDSKWREYEGGIQDWLIQSRRTGKSLPSAAELKTSASGSTEVQNKSGDNPPTQTPSSALAARSSEVNKNTVLKKKLSFKEQRELDALPAQIESLESEQKEIAQIIEEGSIFSTDPKRAPTLLSKSTQIESDLLALLERWEALSAKS
jgi:ATP-binding cassette subfamily F protein uup